MPLITILSCVLFTEGYLAHQDRGRAVADDPYDGKSLYSASWRAGWAAANGEIAMPATAPAQHQAVAQRDFCL